jgi:hypothetical protein
MAVIRRDFSSLAAELMVKDVAPQGPVHQN